MSASQPADRHPVESYPEAVVVHASGDLDAVTGGSLRMAIKEAVKSGAALVVVDMADVGFLDSAGLAVLFSAHRKLPAGQSLALANVPRRMQRVLHVAAVGTLLVVHEQGQPWPWTGIIPETPHAAEGPVQE